LLSRHPSNAFFYQFANAVPFDPNDPNEFATALAAAHAQPPHPLTPTERRALSWAAATDRLAAAIALPAPASASPAVAARPSQTWSSRSAYALHQWLGAGWLGLFLRDATGTLPELPDAAAHAAATAWAAATGGAAACAACGADQLAYAAAAANRGVLARQTLATAMGALGVVLSATTSMEAALAEGYQPSPCDGSAPLLLAKLHDKAEVQRPRKKPHGRLSLSLHPFLAVSPCGCGSFVCMCAAAQRLAPLLTALACLFREGVARQGERAAGAPGFAAQRLPRAATLRKRSN
jgi:hypothetical protein